MTPVKDEVLDPFFDTADVIQHNVITTPVVFGEATPSSIVADGVVNPRVDVTAPFMTVGSDLTSIEPIIKTEALASHEEIIVGLTLKSELMDILSQNNTSFVGMTILERTVDDNNVIKIENVSSTAFDDKRTDVFVAGTSETFEIVNAASVMDVSDTADTSVTITGDIPVSLDLQRTENVVERTLVEATELAVTANYVQSLTLESVLKLEIVSSVSEEIANVELEGGLVKLENMTPLVKAEVVSPMALDIVCSDTSAVFFTENLDIVEQPKMLDSSQSSVSSNNHLTLLNEDDVLSSLYVDPVSAPVSTETYPVADVIVVQPLLESVVVNIKEEAVDLKKETVVVRPADVGLSVKVPLSSDADLNDLLSPLSPPFAVSSVLSTIDDRIKALDEKLHQVFIVTKFISENVVDNFLFFSKNYL